MLHNLSPALCTPASGICHASEATTPCMLWWLMIQLLLAASHAHLLSIQCCFAGGSLQLLQQLLHILVRQQVRGCCQVLPGLINILLTTASEAQRG